MATEYVLDAAIDAAILKMVNEQTFTEFAPLRKLNVVILACAKVLTDSEGMEKAGTGDPVQVKKISPADRVFLDGHYKLYFDHCRWNQANEEQQKAMLHRALMHINVEEIEEGVKFSTRGPDICEFQTTVARFGAWTESLITFRNCLQAAQAKMKRETTEKKAA